MNPRQTTTSWVLIWLVPMQYSKINKGLNTPNLHHRAVLLAKKLLLLPTDNWFRMSSFTWLETFWVHLLGTPWDFSMISHWTTSVRIRPCYEGPKKGFHTKKKSLEDRLWKQPLPRLIKILLASLQSFRIRSLIQTLTKRQWLKKRIILRVKRQRK